MAAAGGGDAAMQVSAGVEEARPAVCKPAWSVRQREAGAAGVVEDGATGVTEAGTTRRKPARRVPVRYNEARPVVTRGGWPAGSAGGGERAVAGWEKGRGAAAGGRETSGEKGTSPAAEAAPPWPWLRTTSTSTSASSATR
ncbi:hypothetical protein [Oryza sativa Japonica Group]|uniref:Uncharacterized protein n=1 Tax=Oryza sativa subsp. japonica TaxID=39947 RepID=Q5SN24_ORYSJ|nr:hypothetical protein [Oryza sativa Japonica Group]